MGLKKVAVLSVDVVLLLITWSCAAGLSVPMPMLPLSAISRRTAFIPVPASLYA